MDKVSRGNKLITMKHNSVMIDCMSASTVAYIIWLLKDNYMRQPVLKNKLIASTMDVNKKLKERIIVTINKTARRGHANVNGVTG